MPLNDHELADERIEEQNTDRGRRLVDTDFVYVMNLLLDNTHIILRFDGEFSEIPRDDANFVIAFRYTFEYIYAGKELYDMPKTSNIFARVEPGLKEQAEIVLEQLGIPMSNAISLFLRQVVLQRGIPFDIKLPADKPLAAGSLPEEEFNAEIEKGFADLAEGRTVSAERVANRMRRDYGV